MNSNEANVHRAHASPVVVGFVNVAFGRGWANISAATPLLYSREWEANLEANTSAG